jgi:hypothetical protein
LAFAGITTIATGLVGWRQPIIHNVRTLPTLKAEAVAPFSADSSIT